MRLFNHKLKLIYFGIVQTPFNIDEDRCLNNKSGHFYDDRIILFNLYHYSL